MGPQQTSRQTGCSHLCLGFSARLSAPSAAGAQVSVSKPEAKISVQAGAAQPAAGSLPVGLKGCSLLLPTMGTDNKVSQGDAPGQGCSGGGRWWDSASLGLGAGRARQGCCHRSRCQH